MWDAVTHLFARLVTLAWFAGAVLMLITIPACIYKIFSALWETDDFEEEPGLQNSTRTSRNIPEKF
jgi:hypothetical protein